MAEAELREIVRDALGETWVERRAQLKAEKQDIDKRIAQLDAEYWTEYRARWDAYWMSIPAYIYTLSGPDGAPRSVGATRDPGNRLQEHWNSRRYKAPPV